MLLALGTPSLEHIQLQSEALAPAGKPWASPRFPSFHTVSWGSGQSVIHNNYFCSLSLHQTFTRSLPSFIPDIGSSFSSESCNPNIPTIPSKRRLCSPSSGEHASFHMGSPLMPLSLALQPVQTCHLPAQHPFPPFSDSELISSGKSHLLNSWVQMSWLENLVSHPGSDSQATGVGRGRWPTDPRELVLGYSLEVWRRHCVSAGVAQLVECKPRAAGKHLCCHTRRAG